MATYAIGDVQGCFKTLCALLERIEFRHDSDQLWFVGDLVNRGPDSLACLRFVRALNDRAVAVLGNHDLHLLAVSEGVGKPGRLDTLAPILDAPDRVELLDWLRGRPMMHSAGEFVMVHAGLLPQWDVALANHLAREVEFALRGSGYRALLANMYGNTPDAWREDLPEMDRHRITINAMTRMRTLTDGKFIDVSFKGKLADLPDGLAPWFEHCHPTFLKKTVVAGHWSALGLHVTPRFFGIDTGCVWGNQLTAIRLEDRKVYQQPCKESSIPKGWD